MNTFQVQGEMPAPNGEWLLTGTASSLSISKGDTCHTTVEDTKAEIIVKNVGMVADGDLLRQRYIGLFVEIQPAKPFPLVGCTLIFHRAGGANPDKAP